MNKKYVIAAIFILMLIIVIIVFYNISSNKRAYSKITYEIDYQQDTLFKAEQLDNYLKKNNFVIINKVIDSINKQEIETYLRYFPYIEQVDVINYKDNLIIKAKQEKVIAKIYNSEDNIFYLSQTGRLLPHDSTIHGRFLIINGNIPNKYESNRYVCEDSLIAKKDSTLMNKYLKLSYLWKIAKYIDENPFWKAQISQIYIDKNNDVILSTTIGNQLILFGKITTTTQIDQIIESRFNNLKTLYINGFKITGWDKYKTINLKYGKEIPCQKR